MTQQEILRKQLQEVGNSLETTLNGIMKEIPAGLEGLPLELKSNLSEVYSAAGAAIEAKDSAELTRLQGAVMFQINGLRNSTTVISTNTTLTAIEFPQYLIDASASDVSIKLPPPNVYQEKFSIKRIDNTNNEVLISVASGENIDNYTEAQIFQNDSLTFKSDGSQYWID